MLRQSRHELESDPANDALPSKYLLYDCSTWNGHGFNSLLAYFIKGKLSLGLSSTSVCWSAFDHRRRRNLALVHLGFLCIGAGNDLANRSSETPGCSRALSICAEPDVRGRGDYPGRRSNVLYVFGGIDSLRTLRIGKLYLKNQGVYLQLLHRKFGESYETYRRSVGRWIPRLQTRSFET